MAGARPSLLSRINITLIGLFLSETGEIGQQGASPCPDVAFAYLAYGIEKEVY